MKQFFILLFMILLGLQAQAQGKAVRFAQETLFFPANFEDRVKDRAVAASEVSEGRFARLVQFERVLTEPERSVFEASGANIYGYINFGAYLVTLPADYDFKSLQGLPVWSVQPIQSTWKTAKNLREQPYGDWAVKGNQLLVQLQVYPHVAPMRAKELCNLHGMVVRKVGRQNGFLEVLIEKSAIDAVASLPFVRHIELAPPPGKPEDILGRSLHRSNMIAGDHALSKKYDGTGVKMLVRDDGLVGPHIDMRGRLTNLTEENSPVHHGDGVGGIMAGAGNLNPENRGMAAGADLFVVDYVSDFQDVTVDLIENQGVTITNTSYSDGCNAGYTLGTQTVDQQLHDNPAAMHVFSAGNSNGADCGYGAGTQWGNITGGHKMAKNAIATANLYSDATLVTSSSRGPAHDGRLKPDIAANGENQVSLFGENGYQSFGGTSGAAPGIAGCLGQLTHAYKTLNAGQQPDAALLKAAILNTANDLGNIGPDFKYGWGHINAGRALQVFEKGNFASGTIAQGEQKTFTIQVPPLTRLAKVMVYWVEPPADEAAAKALVNDLDLRVLAPGGAENLPWLLDPTPDELGLDLPATKGNDDLNNVEQVAIADPAAGTYTVRISGTEVPIGPVKYYVVWEYYNDNLTMVYPNGGEGIAPGDTIRLHWDAYGTATNFTLRYSLDNAANWLPIATVSGDKRMYDWTVPSDFISGEARFLVIRGSRRDTSDQVSSIVPVPADFRVEKVCPDSMTVAWTEINDTLSYDAYLLGDKYMEIVGRSDTTFLTFPISSVTDEKWVAVRAAHANGMTGQRTLAIRYKANLLNCPQPEDLAVLKFLNPAGAAIILCGETEFYPSVTVKNEGLNASSGASIRYQVNNDPPVTEPLPDLLPGASVDYAFATPIVFTQSTVIDFKVQVLFTGDDASFNDAVSATIPVVKDAISTEVTESFDAGTALPNGWTVTNPDGETTFVLVSGVNGQDIIGTDDQSTNAIYLNTYDYTDAIGQEDYLYTLPIDLSNFDKPGLTFSLAHKGYDSNYEDSLRVEVYEDCSLSGAPITVWGQKDPLLCNNAYTTARFIPASGAEWSTKLVDLAAFSGKTIVVRFASYNGYGNNIYLDNIGLTKYDPVPPTALYYLANDTICRPDTVYYSAEPSAGNPSYTWSFGSQAVPVSATGPGPHEVRYNTPGLKNVRLIAVNSFGMDTLTRQLRVLPNPISNFTNTAVGLTATFTNTSLNSNVFTWDFGDGQGSNEVSPVHTYAAPGTYTVKLTAINQCTSIVKTLSLTLTSAVRDLSDKASIRLLPNPTAGDFAVEITALEPLGRTQLSLYDAAGRLVKTLEQDVKEGVSRTLFERLALPKGTYKLTIGTADRQQTLSVTVQ